MARRRPLRSNRDDASPADIRYRKLLRPTYRRNDRKEQVFENATLQCQSVAEAIPQVLDLITRTGRIAMVREEANREVLGVDISITDPTNRVPIVPGRPTPLAFCIVEFLWYCAQRTDLAPLEVYAPNISNYYWGERNVTGSAYGRQIFEKKTRASQWDNVIELLATDPGSKRAFMGVFNAETIDTLTPDNHDVACTTGFHVLIRDGALHWITNMRANDAYRGFVSDIFSFTMFQELLASTVGVPVGHYLHRPASLHTFPEDESSVQRILTAWREAGSTTEHPPPTPRLQHETFWQHLPMFWSLHDRGENGQNWDALADLIACDDPWWTWVAQSLIHFHARSTR